MGDTVVLVTACIQQTPTAGRDFFPLTVNYVEKTYAAGRIPGGFFKREGRPSEKETLTSRLIDRPIRPLFPDGVFSPGATPCTSLTMPPGNKRRIGRPTRRDASVSVAQGPSAGATQPPGSLAGHQFSPT